jgi:hypothetical protein
MCDYFSSLEVFISSLEQVVMSPSVLRPNRRCYSAFTCACVCKIPISIDSVRITELQQPRGVHISIKIFHSLKSTLKLNRLLTIAF